MSNSNRYVKANINNSGLIPQAIPADYPLLVTSEGSQSLTSLIMQYEFDDQFYTFYAG